MSGRVFGASLKPVWSVEQIEDFLINTNGDMNVFIINHDKDVDEEGGKVEAHTHIYIEYSTPRKITTVANLLNVEANFIEIVRNKKGYLRYLTHMDEDEKYRYSNDEVYSNSPVPYEQLILGNSMTDKEIAEYIVQGKGMELLGMVSASKLRTIQGFVHFDQSNTFLREIRDLNRKIDRIVEIAEDVEKATQTFIGVINQGIMSIPEALNTIGTEMKKIRLMAPRKK